jgi:hypothetical protein
MKIVISVLHLSNKYAVEYLRRRALVHLSSHYPTKLSGWDKLKLSSSLFYDLNWSGAFVEVEVAVINIAREVNALWLLPNIFYCLSLVGTNRRHEILNGLVYKGRSVKLSGDDQILFLESNLQITRAKNDLLRFLHSPYTILDVLEDSSARVVVCVPSAQFVRTQPLLATR